MDANKSERGAKVEGVLLRRRCGGIFLVLAACASGGEDAAPPSLPVGVGVVDASAPGSSDASASSPSTSEAGEGASSDASLPGTVDAPSDAPFLGDVDAATDARAPDGGAGDSGAPVRPLPALPLAASSRWIVDANGKRFKLASVNWYGAESKDFVVGGLDVADVRVIAASIQKHGFNSVRLPFSNELVETNPVVAPARLQANPQLQGLTALQALDAVIAALAAEGLVVLLDDHMSDAGWCCSTTDGNGLWYNGAYPEASWIADWRTMVTRYLAQPAVIGVDLRNELRASDAGTPTWGGTDPALDWHAAAERGGNAVLGVNPNLLVVVEGLNFSNDLTGAYAQPIVLSLANRVVYGPHDYAMDHPSGIGAADLATALGNAWGYLLVQGQAYTAPVWVGEIGTCNSSDSCVTTAGAQGTWWTSLASYLTNADIDWGYWAVNGTQSTGTGRTLGAPEAYGVLNPAWTAPASATLAASLEALQPATQGP